MADKQAPPPPLFSPEGADASPQHPALLGGRCTACGGIFFPMQTYGCERCGSVALEPLKIAGRGRLIASAEVFMPAGAHRPAPFTVGSIATDDGAVVRSLLDVPPGARLEAGVAMIARLVEETRPDRGARDLRFAPASNAEE